MIHTYTQYAQHHLSRMRSIYTYYAQHHIYLVCVASSNGALVPLKFTGLPLFSLLLHSSHFLRRTDGLTTVVVPCRRSSNKMQKVVLDCSHRYIR